jgi:hypothetical protein
LRLLFRQEVVSRARKSNQTRITRSNAKGPVTGGKSRSGSRSLDQPLRFEGFAARIAA